MSDLKLKFGFWDYDRTRALADGAVKIDGVAATFYSEAGQTASCAPRPCRREE
jgi:hypothetical protein